MKKCKRQACTAFISHGPGHQSKTRCERTGKHDIHECTYGSAGQVAQWKGDEVFSGFFDEPPPAHPASLASLKGTMPNATDGDGDTWRDPPKEEGP